jgi:SAM-dependent methyltransferase
MLKNDTLFNASRTLNWVSSLDEANNEVLDQLQERMVLYYASSKDYYNEIDYASDAWQNKNELTHIDIVNSILVGKKILEIGCGIANILKFNPLLEPYYTGLEFSDLVIETNKNRFPKAQFDKISNPKRYNLPNGTFDFIFSRFVIEHTVYPKIFLDECMRLLNRGGTLVILCPDFLGCNRIESQRVGLTAGTGREKLARGRVFDALLTAYDTRIKIPLKCARIISRNVPQFMVNLNPTCFDDKYIPDVDAVYLAYQKEIVTYLAPFVRWLPIDDAIARQAKTRRLIYLKGIKK